MKNLSRAFAAISGCIALCFLTACPIESDYPLFYQRDAEAISTPLEGTWVNADQDAEATKVTFKKLGANNYNMEVVEKGKSYAVEETSFSAWTARFEGHDYLIITRIKNGDQPSGKYMLYHLTVNSPRSISTHDMLLKVKGKDAITSVDAYQEEVRGSLKTDEYIKGKNDWTRQ